MHATHPENISVPVAVVGGGPAGLAAALVCARLGFETLLIAAPHRPAGHDRDRRTAALFAGSIELLKNLGVWELCATSCAPLTAIRIIDDTGAILKAPEVTFSAPEAGLDAFGYNVPNDVLVEALQTAARATPSLTIVETAAVETITAGPDSVELVLPEGPTLLCKLLVAADGRHSIARKAAGIATDHWTYPQSALVTWFEHQRSHRGVSTEFHRPAGPFTTVPLPGNASSLVWVERPEEALRLAALDDSSFTQATETRLQGLLGRVGSVGPRAVFPLSGLNAKSYAARRIALAGETAHVLPPIGAQGLNLSLRDAAALGECMADAQKSGDDPGSDRLLNSYAQSRSADIASRVWTIDLLNRSLISSFLPVQILRGLGLHVLYAVAPLRRVLTREGLQPSFADLTLMQPNGLEALKSRLPDRPPPHGQPRLA